MCLFVLFFLKRDPKTILLFFALTEREIILQCENDQGLILVYMDLPS